MLAGLAYAQTSGSCRLRRLASMTRRVEGNVQTSVAPSSFVMSSAFSKYDIFTYGPKKENKFCRLHIYTVYPEPDVRCMQSCSFLTYSVRVSIRIVLYGPNWVVELPNGREDNRALLLLYSFFVYQYIPPPKKNFTKDWIAVEIFHRYNVPGFLSVA